MNLLEHERKSPLWQKLRKHFENELMSLRERNDADLTELETARLRGKVKQVKEFLLLETPAETDPDDSNEPSGT
jgi:hypothetical protein